MSVDKNDYVIKIINKYFPLENCCGKREIKQFGHARRWLFSINSLKYFILYLAQN